MTFKMHQIVMIRARIMTESNGEWSCAPVDRAGHDIENALVLTVPHGAIISISDAAQAISKRRIAKPEEEW